MNTSPLPVSPVPAPVHPAASLGRYHFSCLAVGALLVSTAARALAQHGAAGFGSSLLVGGLLTLAAATVLWLISGADRLRLTVTFLALSAAILAVEPISAWSARVAQAAQVGAAAPRSLAAAPTASPQFGPAPLAAAGNAFRR